MTTSTTPTTPSQRASNNRISSFLNEWVHESASNLVFEVEDENPTIESTTVTEVCPVESATAKLAKLQARSNTVKQSWEDFNDPDSPHRHKIPSLAESNPRDLSLRLDWGYNDLKSSSSGEDKEETVRKPNGRFDFNPEKPFFDGLDYDEEDQDKPFICIVGLIGAGKSTLTERLALRYGVKPYYENTENPLLPYFYKDMSGYSFLLNVSLLDERYAQQEWIHSLGEGGVCDKLIYEDLIFCELLLKNGMMTKQQYDVYVRVFQRKLNKSKKPDVVVYLKVDPEVALERIRKRGREWEKDITLEYLVELAVAYDKWILKLATRFTIITFDWNSSLDLEEVVNLIEMERNDRKAFNLQRTSRVLSAGGKWETNLIPGGHRNV